MIPHRKTEIAIHYSISNLRLRIVVADPLRFPEEPYEGGMDEVHLIIFDLDSERSWEEKIFGKVRSFKEKKGWGLEGRMMGKADKLLS